MNTKLAIPLVSHRATSTTTASDHHLKHQTSNLKSPKNQTMNRQKQQKTSPRSIKLYKTSLNFFNPKKRNPLFYDHQPTIGVSPSTTFYRLLSPSSTKKRILFSCFPEFQILSLLAPFADFARNPSL
ncbi:MAG: hypothetical protein ACXWC8_18195 [Limisphaerales bacterium]